MRNACQPWSGWSDWSGGKFARVGDGASGDAQRGGEADPVGVVAGVRAASVIRPDREVAAQVSPDLLPDQVGRLGAEHHSSSSLVGLELVERALDLPPLGVGGGQLGGGRLFGIEQGGQQSVLGGVLPAVVDPVVDDPGQHEFAGGSPWSAAGGPARTRQAGPAHAAVGARRVGADPPQQIRAGSRSLAPQREGEEPAVGQQHHPRRKLRSSCSASAASDSR